MIRLKVTPAVLAVLAVLPLLASCAAPSQSQHTKAGQVIEMTTYTVQAPEGDDWRFQADKGNNAVTFLKEKKNVVTGALFGMWTPGATMITVYTNKPLREKRLLAEEVLADDIRNTEENDMMERGVKTGEYRLENVKKETVSLDGKKLYTMSYITSAKDRGAENVLYVYFPPEFKEDRLFYEFLISEAYMRSGLGAATSTDLTQIYPVIRSFRSFSVVQAFLAKLEPSHDAPALILASWKGDNASVRELLAKGADANMKGRRGMRPLHFAAGAGRKEAAGLLIQGGADVNATDDSGFTALKVAVLADNEIVAILLDSGADINTKGGTQGWTALEFAIGTGRTEAAKLLIERGADIHQKDLRGGTALALAVYNGRDEIAKMLIEKGAEVNTQLDDGWTPLMDATDTGNTEIARLLIDRGADVNSKSKTGWTALMAAALYGHADIAKILIEKGADVNAKNSAGTTVLQTAKLGKHEEVVTLLKEAGARE